MQNVKLNCKNLRVISLKWEDNQQVGVKEIRQDVVDHIQLPKGTVSGRILKTWCLLEFCKV
jgi:hypothetical protein